MRDYHRKKAELEKQEQELLLKEHREKNRNAIKLQRYKKELRRSRNARLITWGSQIEYHLKLAGIPQEDITLLSNDAIKAIIDSLFHDRGCSGFLIGMVHNSVNTQR